MYVTPSLYAASINMAVLNQTKQNECKNKSAFLPQKKKKRRSTPNVLHPKEGRKER